MTTNSTIEVPIRILVPGESVGAIIGKSGQTIKQLTQSVRAKVDIHRNEPFLPQAFQEKVITIRGPPENCINAVREILKLLQDDLKEKGKLGEIPLKLLAHNDFIGRIIGKGGNIINAIKKDTNTNVTVSSVQDMTLYNVERVITIRGELENLIKALEVIYQKIRTAYEMDNRATMSAPNGGFFNVAVPPAIGMISSFQNLQLSRPAFSPFNINSNLTAAPQIERVYLYIPHFAVGAIIGTKGTFIKYIIKLSGASIKITPTVVDANEISKSESRQVIIVGTPEAQWKAQYCIYEKLKQEGFAGSEELHLTAEIQVPPAVIGRIIGKQGRNVRELQKATGAIIKLPQKISGRTNSATTDDSTKKNENQTEASADSKNDLSIQIIGHFHSSQFAQRRIQTMIQQSLRQRNDNVSTKSISTPLEVFDDSPAENNANVDQKVKKSSANIPPPRLSSSPTKD